jgi:hypothetical protein
MSFSKKHDGEGIDMPPSIRTHGLVPGLVPVSEKIKKRRAVMGAGDRVLLNEMGTVVGFPPALILGSFAEIESTCARAVDSTTSAPSVAIRSDFMRNLLYR